LGRSIKRVLTGVFRLWGVLLVQLWDALPAGAEVVFLLMGLSSLFPTPGGLNGVTCRNCFMLLFMSPHLLTPLYILIRRMAFPSFSLDDERDDN